MGDFSAEGAVVHEEDVEIADASDYEFFKAVGEIVSSLLVGAVTDLGHLLVASESSPHSVVDAYVRGELPLGLLQDSASLPP